MFCWLTVWWWFRRASGLWIQLPIVAITDTRKVYSSNISDLIYDFPIGDSARSNSGMERINKIVILICNFLGYLALCSGGYFVWMYAISEEHPLRHELGIGLGISILYGSFPALLSLGLSFWKKRTLPKWLLNLSIAILPFYVLLCVIYSAI